MPRPHRAQSDRRNAADHRGHPPADQADVPRWLLIAGCALLMAAAAVRILELILLVGAFVAAILALIVILDRQAPKHRRRKHRSGARSRADRSEPRRTSRIPASRRSRRSRSGPADRRTIHPARTSPAAASR